MRPREEDRSRDEITRWAEPAEGVPSARADWLPASFVVFALLALLIVPLALGQRVDSVRGSVVEPGTAALAEINAVRHSFSRSEAALRGLLLTGEPRFQAALQDAARDRGRTFARLTILAGHLDPGLAAEVGALRVRSDRADGDRAARLEDVLAGRVPEELIRGEEAEHDALVAASADVERRVVEITEAGRSRIERTRRIGLFLTVALVVLALVAGGLVVWVGRGHRRRAMEEAELRAAAFALTEPTEVGEVLRRIAETVARIRKGEHSFVERLDREAGDVVVVASAGAGAPAVGTRVPYPGSLTEEAIRSRSPEVVPRIGATDRPIAPILSASCGGCVALVVPLMADHDPHGALVILRAAGSRFSKREIVHRRALGVLAALTLRKTVLLEQAQEQQQALERIAESRGRLVRGFSHDVKNPLGAADGHAQLLMDGILGELGPRQAESVRRIRAGIRSALELIQSLVDLARAEAGQLELEWHDVDVAEIAREAARVYGAAADAAGLRFRLDTDESLPTVRSDPRRVRQILGNLLSNAIKYTGSDGEVRLTAGLRSGPGARDRDGWVTLSVHDTGRGIPSDARGQLFTEFGRVAPHAAEGAGLGLAISDRLAHLLGGEITVESEEDVGSTFTLWLPPNGRAGDGQ